MDKYEERTEVVLQNHGQKVFGIFHRPTGIVKPPCVLFCHGLAGHKIGEHRVYVYLAEQLSKAGVASLRIDFRGSGDSEGEFSEMTLKGEVSDALLALNFLQDSPLIDAKRIGVYGRSFGAAVATIAAEKFGNIQSIALWAPIFDGHQWEEAWEMQESGEMDAKRRHQLMMVNGQLPSVEFYSEIFTMNLAAHIRKLSHVPFFLIHGEKDPIISIEHSERYVKVRSEDPAAKTEFIRIPHSDHDFTNPEEKQLALKLTTKWFKETLHADQDN